MTSNLKIAKLARSQSLGSRYSPDEGKNTGKFMKNR